MNRRIHVVNKGLTFYENENEVDIFISDHMLAGEWGLPEEIEIKVYEWKSTKQIMNEIFTNCTSQEQQFRIVDALDIKSSFATALDNDNYDLARYKMQECLTLDLITEDDMILVNSVIPTGAVIYEL